jgi:hypothetical protein
MDFVCGVAGGAGLVVVFAEEVVEVGQGSDDRVAAASGEFGEQRLEDFFFGVARLDLSRLALDALGDVDDGATPVGGV